MLSNIIVTSWIIFLWLLLALQVKVGKVASHAIPVGIDRVFCFHQVQYGYENMRQCLCSFDNKITMFRYILHV